MDHTVATDHHEGVRAGCDFGVNRFLQGRVVPATQDRHVMAGLPQPRHDHVARVAGGLFAVAAKGCARIDGHSDVQDGVRRGGWESGHGKSQYVSARLRHRIYVACLCGVFCTMV